MSKLSNYLMLSAALICVHGCIPASPIPEPASKASSKAIEVAPELVALIPDVPLFRNLATERGIDFHHDAGATGQFLMPEIMGSGAALLDFDRDGDLDVYLVNGGPTASRAQNSAGANQLFRQDDAGQFENVTEAIGGGDEHFGMGVAVADVNNDGFPDLYITNYGPDQLYLNDKGTRLVNVTADAGISNDRWSVSSAFADIDRDGWLDLYVANYVDYDPSRACPTADGLPDYCNPLLFPGTTDLLLVNTGTFVERDGLRIPKFRDTSLESGIASVKGAGLGVALIDANQDGWIDWYVANDMTANFLWINQQNGTFVDQAIVSGVAFDGIGNGQASMGIVVADIDENQLEDVFVTHLNGETNTLYLQTESSLFEVATHPFGLGRSSFPETGFGVAALDFENDGDMDFAIVNGKVTLSTDTEPRTEVASGLDAYAQRNHLYLRQAKDKFVTVDDPGFSSSRLTTRGLAAGDIDNDGDVDLLLNNADAPAELWFNDAAKAGHWIELQATLPAFANRDATGALVTVVAGNIRWTRRLTSSGSYASAHAERLSFGLGDVEKIDAVQIEWPDGELERYNAADHGITVNQRFELKQGTSTRIDGNLK